MNYGDLRQRAANDTHIETLDALEATSTQAEAAELLGVSVRTVERRLAAIRESAPVWRTTARMRGKDGKVSVQWEKPVDDGVVTREDVLEALKERIPAEPRVEGPPSDLELPTHLLNAYIVSDFHLGQLSWGEEVGESYDLKIAEDLIFRWFDTASAFAPRVSEALMVNLGDFLHYDSLLAITPTSGHVLDSDSRYQKIIRAAIRVQRRIVRMLLSRHDTVHIIHAEGNHDPAGSAWLREMTAELYRDNPRVTVDTNPNPFYLHEFGRTSLFFHHGHNVGPNRVAEAFITRYREAYGRTKYSYAHVGHLHHSRQMCGTIEVEQHPTLAAGSSFEARHGYDSDRRARVITYSKEHGEVSRISISPDMIT